MLIYKVGGPFIYLYHAFWLDKKYFRGDQMEGGAIDMLHLHA